MGRHVAKSPRVLLAEGGAKVPAVERSRSGYAVFSVFALRKETPARASERFRSGELFDAFLPVAASGAVLVTRLVSEGSESPQYILTVLPKPL